MAGCSSGDLQIEVEQSCAFRFATSSFENQTPSTDLATSDPFFLNILFPNTLSCHPPKVPFILGQLQSLKMYQTTLKWTSNSLTLKKRYDPRTYTPEEATKSLALLTFELPDPSQSLAVQSLSSQSATIFHRFSELPFEIRTIIFKLCLPGRRVHNLAPYSLAACDPQCPGCNKDWDFRPRGPSPPVTLSINQESRNITLEKYFVIFQKDTGYVKMDNRGNVVEHERALIINPEIDHVWVEFRHLLDDKDRFKEAYEQAVECFEKIQSLELRNFSWCQVIHPDTLGQLVQRFESCDGGILKYFEELEELRLVATNKHPKEEMEAAIEAIRDGVEYEMMSDFFGQVGRSYPEIIFYAWRGIRVRSDEEYEWEELIEE
ncbi:uncharacterized protein PAC_10095 [Phialocephala subalpina]|uniref:2EXR domain-containing protein n=1 Tax=Phialocephala subalpina TaxID=576137 RepID=A0A1L7X5A0_9HELO|nr:uncharacterized protein PAC_10095 [Phialocephala subalpina]